MKHLLVIAHPNKISFNHAVMQVIAETLQSGGQEVTVRDLYQLDFEPVLSLKDFNDLRSGATPADIKTEQEHILRADVITFIYPIWWTGLPAILKGYVDRVFAYGFAYKYAKDGTIEKLLSGKKGVIVNTYGSPSENYDSIGMTDALKKTSDTGIFEFCGIEAAAHLLFGSVPQVDDAARKIMLKQVEEQFKSLFLTGSLTAH